jgi:hypothetical protein
MLTTIKSNNQAVDAVANVYRTMVKSINDNRHEGRGFLYCRQDDAQLWFISLSDFEKDDGAALIDIDPEQYQGLLDLVRSGYDFDNEFVFVVRQDLPDNVLFSANVGSLHNEGWTGFRSKEDIKTQEAQSQKAIAKLRLEQMKRDRTRGKRRR